MPSVSIAMLPADTTWPISGAKRTTALLMNSLEYTLATSCAQLTRHSKPSSSQVTARRLVDPTRSLGDVVLGEAESLLPILGLCSDENGESALGLSQEEDDEILEKAPDLLPGCILEIAEFWRRRDSAETSKTTAPKAARNDRFSSVSCSIARDLSAGSTAVGRLASLLPCPIKRRASCK